MSLAMKYAMKKKMAKGGMCPGADCPGCGSAMCYGGKMAEGGEAEKPDSTDYSIGHHQPGSSDHRGQSVAGDLAREGKLKTAKGMHKDILSSMKSMKKPHLYAEGGEVDEKAEYDPVENPQPVHNMAAMIEDDDMIARIMKKRYSQGGEVANDVGEGEEADMEPNQFDDLVKDDDLEADYTGENSGDEIGDEQEDDDRKDIVSRIMKSRAKKDRMPRPA